MSIPRKLKICKCGCGTEGYIWASGMIKEHYLKSDKGKAQVKKANAFVFKEKTKTGELDFFIEMWSKLKPAKEMTKTVEELEKMEAVEYFEYVAQFRICSITLEPLVYFVVQSFSHVLSKGSHPRFRLESKNIKLVKPEIHTIYEFESREKLLIYVGGRKIGEYHDYLKQIYNGVK
jgi:hypothetical protein